MRPGLSCVCVVSRVYGMSSDSSVSSSPRVTEGPRACMRPDARACAARARAPPARETASNATPHGAALALARVRPVTAAHLPGAPQEEREDLLDVLAQELTSAVHVYPPLSQPRPKPIPDRDPNPNPPTPTMTATPTPTSTPNPQPQPRPHPCARRSSPQPCTRSCGGAPTPRCGLGIGCGRGIG